MDNLQLLIDLHIDGQRLGPGGDAQTALALALSGLADGRNLKVADIGCGTGASTMLLARKLDAQITAIDLIPEFLDVLKHNAAAAGLSARLDTQAVSMDAMPFADASLDAIWSEGAIYNIGFEHGINAWKRYLRPGGILAVSELTWLTAERPEELQQHWDSEYPETATASHKIAQLEAAGYTIRGYFPLPQECWLQNYYDPLRDRFDHFLKRHGSSARAQAIVQAERAEIDLYERHADYVSYGFYIAQKRP